MWFTDDLDKQIEEMNRFNKLVERVDKEPIIRKKATVNFSTKIAEKILDKKERKKLKRVYKRIRQKPRSYGSYIKSKIWERRKNQYWKNHKKTCSACDSSSYIELHHAIYSGFDGTEKDSHLFPLCKNCHKDFHNEYGSKANMLNDTKIFILIKKSGK